MLTEVEKKQYYDNGFLILRNMISQNDLPRYQAAFERMVEKVRAYPGRDEYNTRIIGRQNPKTGTRSGTSSDELEYWGADWLLHPDLYEPEFTEMLDNERLISSLQCFLGNDLEIYGIKALWSPVKVTYDLDWHRDGDRDTYSQDGVPPGWLQFNTALYREECFRAVPGSHLRPLTDEENAKYGTTEYITHQEICVLEPGDCLFMHQAILHRGMAAPSPKRRSLHTILARTDFAVGTRRLQQFKTWYEEQNLAAKMGPMGRKVFENFFAWEGRTFDDKEYPYPSSNEEKRS